MTTISSSLRASARSAYRDLYRASSSTFTGDPRVLKAFRAKMRNDSSEALKATDDEAYSKTVTLSRDMAKILRHNVVQASKSDDDKWLIRINRDTEIGDNESVKTPCGTELTSRRARKQEKEASTSAEHNSSLTAPAPRNYSALKRAHKARVLPELNESDLVEQFVKGSGPGGQSVNKTENNVKLLHKPTGIRVSNHETRSLQTNRMLARRNLMEQLDRLQNPGLSKGELKKAQHHERERRRRKKAKKKAQERADETDDTS